MGIGLTLVRDIVEAHDGTVTVSSEAGRGTTFTVALSRSHRTIDGGGPPTGV
jgi:signal transduction histidine kinase